MHDALVQLGLQVPALALVCWVVWKLGTLAITKWSEGDAQRTKALVEGLANIVEQQREHAAALARVETKVDQIARER